MNIEEMTSAMQDVNVAYTQFMLKYKKGANILYCCFEGKDDKKYYVSAIRHVLGEHMQYRDITCYGKHHVRKLHETITSHSEYNDAKIAYFIDRDFDPANKNPDFFETCGYAIENYYSSKDVLEGIMRHELEMSEHDEEYEKVLEIFGRLQCEFHKEILILNSWLCCQRKASLKNKDAKRLKIDHRLKKFFSAEKKLVGPNLNLTLPDWHLLKSKTDLETLFSPDFHAVSDQELIDQIQLFELVNQQKTFRGKFELKFFIDFLHRLVSEIGNSNSKVFTEIRKCNLRFEYATAISALSQYSELPTRLLSYLRDRIGAGNVAA